MTQPGHGSVPPQPDAPSPKTSFDVGLVRREMLLGRLPRHLFDVILTVPPLDGDVLTDARRRVVRAAHVGCQVADHLERTHLELECIENAGLSGAFRRLLGIGRLAVDVHREFGEPSEDVFRLDVASLLGGWVWLHLGIADADPYCQGVASTRKFEAETGQLLLDDAEPLFGDHAADPTAI